MNNKPNGYWKNYYDNGKLKSEGNRVNYDLDGIWKFYTSDGSLFNYITYSNGRKTGNKITFDPVSGDTLIIENFLNDKKEGNTLYFTKSKLIRLVPFIDGKENGVGKEFDIDGTLISLVYYKSGFISRQERINRRDFLGRRQGLYKSFFDNTLKERVIANYTDDKLNGYYKEFNERGDIVKNEKWIDGVLQKNTKETRKLDIRKDYYDSGTLKSVSTYYNGKLEGTMRIYNDSGIIIGSKQYINGVLTNEGILDEYGLQQGLWKEYDSEGELRAVGAYENGKKTGIWKFYYSNGVIEQVGSFFKGKPHGEWIWYFANGSTLRKETFSKGVPDGNYFEYDSLGQLIISGSFQDGEANGEWFFIDNDCKTQGFLKDGLKNGIWTSTFLSNGRIARKWEIYVLLR
jgi:antitoxin component YwqK of YwqJK toxin-antitoxin module